MLDYNVKIGLVPMRRNATENVAQVLSISTSNGLQMKEVMQQCTKGI